MKKIPLAVQLYSVRKSMAKDMPGTLKKIAEIGYKGVEFAGGFAWPAEDVKAALDAAGLVCCGWHMPWTAVDPIAIHATIAYNKIIGNKNLVVPGLPKEMTATEADWHETAKKFNASAAIAAKHGMRLGYHNHNTEFTVMDTKAAWDIIIGETDSSIIGQLDNGNAMSGGAEPLDWLKKYPGRAYTSHLKPYSKENGYVTMIGEDSVDYEAWFAELDKQGVSEWYIVEYECEDLYTDIEGVKLCYDALVKMGL